MFSPYSKWKKKGKKIPPKLTTALPAAHRSAHTPTGKLAFSTLTPVMMDPASVRIAAPTRKFEYGPVGGLLR